MDSAALKMNAIINDEPSAIAKEKNMVKLKITNTVGNHLVVLPGLGLVNHRHVEIALKHLEMVADEVLKLIGGMFRFLNYLPESVENLLGFVAEKLQQDVVLVFEVQIDGTVGHPGLPGNRRDGGFIEPLLRENLDRRLKDTVVFVV